MPRGRLIMGGMRPFDGFEVDREGIRLSRE